MAGQANTAWKLSNVIASGLGGKGCFITSLKHHMARLMLMLIANTLNAAQTVRGSESVVNWREPVCRAVRDGPRDQKS